jgi:riboflavin kinase / FMN adenylyltransferase
MPGLRIIRHPGSSATYRRGAVLAMGNFDGLHKGHASLLDQTCALARTRDAPTAVLTFEPHPRNVFAPGCEPFRLTPFRVKEREIARLGVDFLFIQHFDAAFSKQSAESFIDEVMVGAIGAAHIVVGHDCTFGNRRRGTPQMLRERGAELGFGVTVVEPVRGEGAVYSSTHIRELLKAGKPREAAAQLGRFWEIDGRVALGDQRGRTIGFPTANVPLGRHLEPARGVYAVTVRLPDGSHYGGVANIGRRPTVADTTESRLEVNLYDFDGDLYDLELTVSVHAFLRAEQKFPSLDALKTQIAADAQAARLLLQGSASP